MHFLGQLAIYQNNNVLKVVDIKIYIFLQCNQISVAKRYENCFKSK